jgi:hypothetical protein
VNANDKASLKAALQVLADSEDFVMVPREPTREMLEAIQKAQGDHGDFEDWCEFSGSSAIAEYKAALAAWKRDEPKERI